MMRNVSLQTAGKGVRRYPTPAVGHMGNLPLSRLYLRQLRGLDIQQPLLISMSA